MEICKPRESRRLLSAQTWRVMEAGLRKSLKRGDVERFKDVLVELAKLDDYKGEGEKRKQSQFLIWATNCMVREHKSDQRGVRSVVWEQTTGVSVTRLRS